MCCSEDTKLVVCKQARNWEWGDENQNVAWITQATIQVEEPTNLLLPSSLCFGRPNFFSLLTSLLKGKWN